MIAITVPERAAMRNNLQADVQSRIDAAVGSAPAQPIYRNRFDAIPAATRYRSTGRLHPRATVRGQSTAIVVGPQDAPVHTHRDHCVRVQCHWQLASNGKTTVENAPFGPFIGNQPKRK